MKNSDREKAKIHDFENPRPISLVMVIQDPSTYMSDFHHSRLSLHVHQVHNFHHESTNFSIFTTKIGPKPEMDD